MVQIIARLRAGDTDADRGQVTVVRRNLIATPQRKSYRDGEAAGHQRAGCRCDRDRWSTVW